MERLHEQLRGAAPNKRELHTALTSIKSKVATIKGEIKKEVAPLQARPDSKSPVSDCVSRAT